MIRKASTHNACRRRLRQVTCNRARAVLSHVTVVPEARYSGSADEDGGGKSGAVPGAATTIALGCNYLVQHLGIT